MKNFNRLGFVLLSCFLFSVGYSEGQIHAGKITFERKTNLHKKFPDQEMRRWIGDEKYKYDMFYLYFNDTMSVFLPEEINMNDRSNWTTVRNKVISYLQRDQRYSLLNVWGEEVVVADTLKHRTYKIIPKKREIAGYNCQMVRFDQNDSIRIYLWYTDAILPSVGPESYLGLPGAILGLATEDGGVVYFATKVEELEPDFQQVLPKFKTNKSLTEIEMIEELSKRFAGSPWGDKAIKELFMW
ncbi:GLPGLI family protein [Wandonia haliotis]|uniref:GLPGLI family protein n=1 Tax=Wandonia haliotis TaxID=574963 RepID=A0ABN1MLV4_9FLAO